MFTSKLFIIATFAFLIGQLKVARSLVLLGVSAFMIYWLQPASQRRGGAPGD